MGLEKFNAVHSFLSNTEDGDIIRGNIKTDNSVFATVKSAGKEQYLYKRTGFFGRLWQGIFASSGGATQRRQEAATLIKAAIGEVKNIKGNENNAAISLIVTKIENLIRETSKDFDTKSIRDKFRELAIYTQDITIDGGSVDKLSVTETNEIAADKEIDLLNSIPLYEKPWEQEIVVYEDQYIEEPELATATETTSLPYRDFPVTDLDLKDSFEEISDAEMKNINKDSKEAAVIVQDFQMLKGQHIAGAATTSEITSLPLSDFSVKGSHPDPELTNPVTTSEIPQPPLLIDISRTTEDEFGLIPIKSPLTIRQSVRPKPLALMHADAYIAPTWHEDIGIFNIINGVHSKENLKKTTEEKVFNSPSFTITQGTRYLKRMKSNDTDERKFYKVTATVPDFIFLVKKDLSPEQLKSYNASCIDYQENLSKIYDEAFEELFTSGTEAGKPIQTIALLPLSQIANQVRDVEIEAMVFSVRNFQKNHPGVNVAILTKSEPTKLAINRAFKAPPQVDNLPPSATN